MTDTIPFGTKTLRVLIRHGETGPWEDLKDDSKPPKTIVMDPGTLALFVQHTIDQGARLHPTGETYNGAPIYKTVHKKHVTYTTFEEVDVVDYGKMQ